MSSTTNGPEREPRVLDSIKGKIALANLASGLVLLVVAAIATMQFRELERLLNEVSSGAEVLMRLSHAHDEREAVVQSFTKGYADDANQGARVRFAALVEDLERHTRVAREKLGADPSGALLDGAAKGMSLALQRARRIDGMPAEEREVAAIEIEEALTDAGGQIGQAKLEASRAMERRLSGVKTELQKPVRLFWGATAIGCLLAVGISVFLRARVSRPIEKLSDAVSALARGEPTPVSVTSRDELARLGTAFNGMAETITERSRSLKLVLDSVGDGLLTCDLLGVVVGEPSKNALSWFGSPRTGATFAEYLIGGDERLREWFVLGFEQLASGVLTFDEAVEQIPKEFGSGDRTFAISFRPVQIDGALARILIVVTDVTERRLLARKEREARDVHHLASVALREPEAFTDFVADTGKRLGRVAAGTDVLLELHTIKGNSSVMGCDHFASHVHDAESRQVENLLSATDVADLESHFRELARASEAAVGRAVNSALMIPRREYERLNGLLAAHREREAQLLVRSWSMQRMDSVFDRLTRTVEQYAKRTGKLVAIESDSGHLVVPRGPLDEFWSCLVHLVKNTVVHGIESEDARLDRGKPTTGKVSFSAVARNEQLSVTVRDDGVGIDWDVLDAAHLDGARRLDALTRRGSSAREVNEAAGRGVGLSAVRKVVESLGGSMIVKSEKGRGTDVIATVPVSGVFRVSDVELAAAARAV